jgi:hypothetical protein
VLKKLTWFAGIVDLTRGWVRRCLPWWDLWSGRYRWCRWLAEEPDQSLDVLGGGCEEELLSHELQPAQTEPSKADVALQFREERFDLFPLSLCVFELRCGPEMGSASQAQPDIRTLFG